ncbi:unnamed protein product [Kuraishia capsulata CBS 1993]|uniref:Protein kinase domain-containing protein n=1 Tax=Kuraishia capsulata CBS 1993 TaxID=1382522 RepID=W6MN04_9ASCO|nr:uncharacterized protein KUCA_T00003961001 [Kuraishia capsulata CBS 1993]CDK27981.1 unnamed protein product [Kuraishia capsulata CBS 1993]
MTDLDEAIVSKLTDQRLDDNKDFSEYLGDLETQHLLDEEHLSLLPFPSCGDICYLDKTSNPPIFEGSGGIIWKSRIKAKINGVKIGDTVAIKCLLNPENKKPATYMKNSLSEFLTMKRGCLKNHSISQVYAICRDMEDGVAQYSLVLPYFKNGDLLSLLTKVTRYNLAFPQSERDLIFCKIINAVKALQNENIVHRDIKPENVLIDDNGDVKLGDFGYAIYLAKTEMYEDPTKYGDDDLRNDSNFFLGTKSFKAPELFQYDPTKEHKPNHEGLNLKASDIWSLGLFYFLVSSIPRPWKVANSSDKEYKDYARIYGLMNIDEATEADINMNIISQPALPKFKKLPDSSRECILKMLNPDPQRRWDIKQVTRSEWFRDRQYTFKSKLDDKTHRNEFVLNLLSY